MSEPLDVLVVQSHPRVADESIAALEAAGHRVHRCHDDDDRTFPCRGVRVRSSCPLDRRVDVALVVRRGLNPWPTHLEGGVSCAIRAGVPIVEEGPAALDPFAPWITQRLVNGSDVVAGCTEAASAAYDPLRRDIAGRIARLLAVADIDAAAVDVRFEVHGPSFEVHVSLPTAVTRGIEQAIAVRVLDAVRSDAHTYGKVDVHVHALEG